MTKLLKKDKPCRLCGGKRVNGLTICYACFRKREQGKRLLKIVKLKERKRKKVEKSRDSYSYLKKKAWGLMSEYIRKKGADENGFNTCYTCGVRKHYKQLQAGHFWHDKLDFDERNLKPQCPRCNTYLSGNLAVYATKLLKEIREEGFERLDYDAHIKVYSRQNLIDIIAMLRQ